MHPLAAPTPAAVRGVIRPAHKCTEAELDAFRMDPRKSTSLLIDHIEAVAAEMRAAAKTLEAIANTETQIELRWKVGEHALHLHRFANQLEGIEP